MRRATTSLLVLLIAACADLEPKVGPANSASREDEAECGTAEGYGASEYADSGTPCSSAEGGEYADGGAADEDAGPYPYK